MKRWMIIAAALALGGCNNKPAGFGVDVEARTNMLSSSVRASIVTARLLVSGDETFAKDIGNVAKAAQSGAFKFRYVPGVRSGTITIRVDGVDGSGATVAGGTAPPVNLTDGKAVDALLTLAVNGNGVTCMAATDCISGNCVDGVCCDTACDGVCESCNQPGLVGQCAPAMQGTDPDNDCAAKLPPTTGADGGSDDDGGTDDGGVATPVGDNPQACAGTCNGSRACAFPDNTVSCGTNICAATAKVAGFFCDSMGSCTVQVNQCADFNCKSGACQTLCNSDADCQPTDFCNLNINKCVAKHNDGTPCSMGDECATGFCYSGVCCNTVCGDSTQSCNNPGNVGQCQCTGHACPSGVACQLFYRDGDGDTFGDSTATLTNGRAVAGCVGDAAPKIGTVQYTSDNTDCDDGDVMAHPGATGFFTTSTKGTGSFDYNCDGVLEKGTAEIPGGSCVFCGNGIPICNNQTNCVASGQQASFGCQFFFKGCRLGATTAIIASGLPMNDCGLSEPTLNCLTCATMGLPAQTSNGSVIQSCH